ncbi:MAG: A24 family peptidase [bacterium]|nr:A24 family peptidase [bacterium]
MNPRLGEVVSSLFLAVILAVAAISDVRSHKIPNRLTLSAMGAGIIYHICLSGWRGGLFSLAGAIAGLGLLFGFYLLGGMGAGDVKLMGAVGSFLGPKGVLVAFVATGLVGGIYAAIILVFHGRVRDIGSRFWARLKAFGAMAKTFFYTRQLVYLPAAKEEKRPRLYYGLAIALGTMVAILTRVLAVFTIE